MHLVQGNPDRKPVHSLDGLDESLELSGPRALFLDPGQVVDHILRIQRLAVVEFYPFAQRQGIDQPVGTHAPLVHQHGFDAHVLAQREEHFKGVEQDHPIHRVRRQMQIGVGQVARDGDLEGGSPRRRSHRRDQNRRCHDATR